MSGIKLVSHQMRTGYRSSENMLIVRSKYGLAGRIPIFYCHGFTLDLPGMYATYLDTTLAGDDIREIAHAGYPVIVADYGGGSTWGNDAHWQSIDQAVTWCGSNLGTRTDVIGLAADSMGFLGIANNAHRSIARVGMIWARVPCCNLEQFRIRNNATFGGAIDGAYGGNPAYLAALPTHDPSASALVATLKTLNKRIFLQATISDELIPTSEIFTYASAVGATVRTYPGTHVSGFQLPTGEAAEFVTQTLGGR